MHAEVVTEYRFDSARRMRPLGKQPAVKQQYFIREALAVAKPLRSHPDYVKKELREAILAALIGHGEAVLLPRAIKERDHAVAEQIEEIPRSRVLVARALREHLRVVMRQHARRSRQPHKRDG